MKTNYENCLAITLKWEGGDVNNPADPGGKTRWGVTQATYDAWRVSQKLAKKSVFVMTKTEMLAIYKANYWDAVSGDTLAVGVDLVTWDYGVNSGPARAKKTLLSVVGGTAVQTIQKLSAKRLSFLKGLTTFKTFGKGWSSRVADVEARAVKMALGSSQATKGALLAEADKAAGKASLKTKAAGTTGAASAASTTVPHNVDQYLSWGILGLIAVGVSVAVYLTWKARHDKERAAAYTRVAEEV
ncbi:glycoside hydrolase family 108 protein [Rhizobium favelukesii]|uniref:Conserved protein n=1 Tax=Rhizobium favelukesii TaxID=348824 RepID=W6RAJ7_9HYPH|nr:glycosyl hydrolase 108 family protein [Rhizobium favelukesii]MCS0459325.1 hypothetical protein [Rhizobium favelukesii]CDM57375.1 putative conserved protein [Rhizobium favelukesii]